MDAKIENSDIVLDSIGNYVMIDGFEEIVQQALIAVKVPKGSFVYDKDLGSDCYSYDYLSDNKKLQVFEMLMNEALSLIGDIYIKVKFVTTVNTRAKLSFTIFTNGESIDKEVMI